MADVLHLVEFQMSFLLFVALAGYLLASRVNQSVVVAEILIGVVVGPSVLGLITYTDFVGNMAHLGAVFLLFVVGMEFRFEDIVKPRYLLIAAVGVVLPWGMGFATSLLFHYPYATSVFVGTALTATSIAITANILKEMGKLNSSPARAIIGAAVIDDVLGLIALTISKGLVSSSFSFGVLALTIGKVFLFLGVGGALGLFGFRRLLSLIDQAKFTKRYPEVTFIFSTMIAFLYAVAAEVMGLSAIVGAFIAGVSLGGVKLRHGRDHLQGSESLQIIFASIFFVSLGVLVDVRALQPHVLIFLSVLTIVAFVSKIVGCGGIALLSGSKVKEASIIGIGMAPRGEVAMIIALIGLDSKLITQDIYVAIILMSLLTTVATPVFLRLLLAEKRAAIRSAQ
jgi:Kef-type K+ transport system membrane component KefB